MNKTEFNRLAKEGYTHIPIVREVFADLDTPLSAYLKLANQPYSYLFESVQGGEKWGRYSFIGLPCKKVIKVHDKKITVEENGQVEQSIEVANPLDWIGSFRSEFKIPATPEASRFNGGLVGYFGHDTVRHIESRLGTCPNPDELATPDILLMVSEELLIFDNLRGKIQIIVHAEPNDAGYDHAQQRLEAISKQLNATLRTEELIQYTPQTIGEQDFTSDFSETAYKAAVQKAQQYIIDGDVMQVVLSQRSTAPFHAPPLNLYRALRTMNPSPYMYFLELGDFQIVGSSPEILVHVENDEVTLRPIAGTRKRGQTVEKDKALEQELLSDPKELAEHLMLIDLGRNDIGRVAETSSVRITDKMIIERYSHVMHIVSNVVGKLPTNTCPIEVLKATFPAGTLTGAPKIRAMEIIDELEPIKRNIYGGAIGYIGWSGNVDTAIAIRTAVIKNNTLYMQAGAGIVYDSVPELEWQETLNKSRVVFKAAAMAAAGLKPVDIE